MLKRVDYPNSHGICPRHAAELVEQSRRIARGFCNVIAGCNEPVVVVDSRQGEVGGAGEDARADDLGN